MTTNNFFSIDYTEDPAIIEYKKAINALKTQNQLLIGILSLYIQI